MLRSATGLSLCLSSVWLLLSWITHNKSVKGSISPSFVSNSRNLLNLRGGLWEIQFTAGHQKYKATALQVASDKFKIATCNFLWQNIPPWSDIGLHLIFNGHLNQLIELIIKEVYVAIISILDKKKDLFFKYTVPYSFMSLITITFRQQIRFNL